VRLWILGSGSHGNALVLEDGASRVLVDAGFSPRALAARLRAAGIAPQSIEACVVTHEHADHARGAAAAALRWGWTLVASRGTLDACQDMRAAGAVACRAGERFTLGAWSFETERASHDASEPLALAATARRSGARVGIAYDLGVAGERVRALLARADVLVIEANHDEEMLRTGPYPAGVKKRIASNVGHLSNRQCADLARAVTHRGLRRVVLAHLSEENNTPALAVGAVRGGLRGSRAETAAASQRRVLALGRDLSAATWSAASAAQLQLEL
jgi:phosphoribosyl 1,2-cyclic phosphodiesterase